MGGRKVVFAVFLLTLAVGGAVFFTDNSGIPSHPTDAASELKPFLQDIDFNDGAGYVLVLRKRGVETLIDQHPVLESYQDKIFASGLNWLAFVPGERGIPDTSIALYRNGGLLLDSNSHRTKQFEFSNIAKHGITVVQRVFTENRQSIETRIEKLEASNAPRFFLLSKPETFNKQDYTLKAYLPAFWVSSEIPQFDTEADFRAIIENGISADERAKTINISLRRQDSVTVLNSNSSPLLDQDGVPLTMGTSIIFYRPRVDISCDEKTDCDSLKKVIAGFSDEIRLLRDDALLDSIEHPLLPKRDAVGDRALNLDIEINDPPWLEVVEHKYSLSYYEETE